MATQNGHLKYFSNVGIPRFTREKNQEQAQLSTD